MKFYLIFIFCFLGLSSTLSQSLYLKINGINDLQTATIDSLGYVNKHENGKSIQTELKKFQEIIVTQGYFNMEFLESNKSNDSTYIYRYDLKNKYNTIAISITESYQSFIPLEFELEDNQISLPISTTSIFLNSLLSKLEKNGFSMAQAKLENFDTSEDGKFIKASLNIDTGKTRKIDDIIINGYDDFPESHRRNIVRLFKNKTFNQKQVDNIYQSFQPFKFAKQFKYPEILFTVDSTKVYVYLEKASANRFDGFVGFANSEDDKIRFNGYLDLMLQNALKGGERLMLYWKSDGNEQTTLNVSTELPYLFKTPFGLKASLNIFKQDSTFQNTKNNIDIGYFFNYQNKLYLGYQSTNSNKILNINNALISDFKSEFITATFEISQPWNQYLFFNEKYAFTVKTGLGNRNAIQKTPQQFASLHAFYNINLNEKNIFFFKTENFFLNSDNFLTNELYRFGGINSIRGFNENSLQANWVSSLNSEYRYMLSPSLFVHSVVDVGYFQDQANDIQERIYTLGFGFGLATQNGIFNLNYANGNSGANEFKLSNSIVHISFKAVF